MNYMFGNFTYKRFFCVLTYACSTSSSFSSGVLQDLILRLGLSLQYHLSGSLSRSVPWGSLRHFRQSSHWTQLWSGSCLKKQKEHFKKNLFFPFFLCSYKIWWLILTTSNHHDSLCWLIVGIWCTNQTPSANCLADSCHISSWQCIKIDRRISSLITSWNQFLKNIHIQWELSNKVQDIETYKHPGEIQVHGERITSFTFCR